MTDPARPAPHRAADPTDAVPGGGTGGGTSGGTGAAERGLAPSRRTVLLGAGAVTALGGTLAACGSGGAAAGAAGTPSEGPLGTTSSIPVGGGKIFADAGVVVTQPTAGQFKGFSTVCPHQGCAVALITGGYIVCPCHNSRFAIADGAPTPDSPARQPLAPVPVTVDGGEVVAG
jgi:Rieske Fe-S protein